MDTQLASGTLGMRHRQQIRREKKKRRVFVYRAQREARSLNLAEPGFHDAVMSVRADGRLARTVQEEQGDGKIEFRIGNVL